GVPRRHVYNVCAGDYVILGNKKSRTDRHASLGTNSHDAILDNHMLSLPSELDAESRLTTGFCENSPCGSIDIETEFYFCFSRLLDQIRNQGQRFFYSWLNRLKCLFERLLGFG